MKLLGFLESKLWRTGAVVLLAAVVGMAVHPAYSFGDEHPQPLGDFTRVDVPLRRVGNLILVRAEVDSVIGDFTWTPERPT